MKTLILLLFTFVMVVTEANAQTAYRTRASGNWNDILTWEKWDGVTWIAPLSPADYPGLADSVYIQLLHTVTLTQDQSCLHLNLNNAIGVKLQLNDHFLSVAGRIALFSGLASFPVSNTNINLGASVNSGTNNTGLIRLIGQSRTAFHSNAWSPDVAGLNLEVLLGDSSSIVTAETSLKVGRLDLVQGHLVVNGDLLMDNGTTGGDIVVGVFTSLHVLNAVLRTTLGGSVDSILVNGTLKLGPGTNQAIQAAWLRVNGALEMKNVLPYTFTVTDYILASGSRLIYSGNAPEQPTGNEFPRNGVKTLVVNTTGSINLSTGKNISDSLIMISGNVNVAAGDSLTLGLSANAVLQHTQGTVIGKMNRYISALTLGVTLFPVGSSTHYRPVVIDFIGVPLSGGDISVAHADVSGGADITPFNDGGFIVNRRSNMYWDVMINGGFVAADVTLRADVSGQDGITDSSQLRLIGSIDNALNFDLLGGITLPVVGNLGALGNLDLDSNNFRVYVGGNVTVNPLPVKYISFTGTYVRTEVIVKWKTASEHNSDFFELQRSTDGKNFIAVANVDAYGTRNTVSEYVYVDGSPVRGNNYYRLAQFDIDRTVHYSPVIRVNASGDEKLNGVSMGPVPVIDQLSVSLDDNIYTRIIVVDMLGETKINYPVTKENMNYVIDMSVLKNGVYFVQFMKGNKAAETRRITKL